MKNNNLVKIIVVGACIGLLATSAFAQTMPPDLIPPKPGSDNPAFDEIIKMLNHVIGFVYWVIYIVAAILITLAGFDLKEGKIAEFAKKMVGGLAVFGSKFLIAALFNAMNGKS